MPTAQSELGKIAKANYMIYSGSKEKPASADGTIAIKLKRKMARVVIDKIDFNDQYETGYSVTAIKIHDNTSGYENGEPKDGTINVESYKTTDGKFYALLSPTSKDDAATFITMTVKANNASETEPETELFVKGIPFLAASNSYTYTLTVGKNKAEIASVTVKDWSNGSSIIENGGDGGAEEQTGK